MKKFLLLSILVVILCATASAAKAALPSVTMLSTKTCPACEQMEKVLKEIDAKYSGKIATAYIHLENNPDLAKKYKIRYVPTLVFRDAAGNEVAREIGYRSLSEVLKIFADSGVKI